jgi:glycosyltransferase involved in cell wall biosynthesis
VNALARPPAKTVRILGIRGVPGRHGGFESFAEDLALFLIARGWQVTVYCQSDAGERCEDQWQGVRLIRIPVRTRGSAGTVEFDWKSTWHASARKDLVLVLGYNTAMFSAVYRLRGIPNLLNMDGVEWQRQKYNWLEQLWFRANENAGCLIADHLIADHPAIEERYLPRRGCGGVSMVPYGSRAVTHADSSVIDRWKLKPYSYALVIARPEPENSILEIVRAYGAQSRGYPLVVLGAYRRDARYQQKVLDTAGSEVIFPGPIYERQVVDALRYFATIYIHGHRVGGTNPSLVEALGASAPVLAHDNRFNRWVCGDAAAFFSDEQDLSRALDRLLSSNGLAELASLRARARRHHTATFELSRRLGEYEQVLLTALRDAQHGRAAAANARLLDLHAISLATHVGPLEAASRGGVA